MKRFVIVVLFLGVISAAGWSGFQAFQKAMAPVVPQTPVTTVKKGDVRFTVSARGELQGATALMLSTPPTGGREMFITYLRQQGELVEPGDVVAKFDTTEQEYALREAEADLGEVEQQLMQADFDTQAKEEEARYSIVRAEAQVKLAELDVRKNPMLPVLTGRQNDIALEQAKDQLTKLKQDVSNRLATSKAAIAIQRAAQMKAKAKADMAKRNIDAMVLTSKAKGYVSIQRNTMSTNMIYMGLTLPVLQTGDTVRAGMPIAQVPDLEKWEVSARITDLDRGHLAEGNDAEITVVAIPGKKYKAKVKSVNNTECRLTLIDPVPEMRPGLSVEVTVITGVQTGVLWIPSQALFESGGRTFVYVDKPGLGFQATDVKLERRSESKVVITGLAEGQRVALANPAREEQQKGAQGVMRPASKS